MGQIEMLDKNIMEACRLYVDNLIKPLYALGKLEDMAVRLAGITETVKPRQIKKAVVVVAGDTAVDKENETGGKQSLLEFRALAKGLAPVSAVARMMEIPLYLIDAGLESDTTGIEGALVKKVIKGTHRGNRAMTREQAAEAITLGMSVARSLAAQGVNAVGLGSIGERAMLSALGVTAAIMKDELQKNAKQNGISIEIKEIGDLSEDPVEFLGKVGSAEIAVLFGLVVQAAKEKMAIVFDNAVTGAAVLAAVETYPVINEYVFPSASYEEPVHQMQMKRLGMKPFLHYDFTLAEGFGSAMGLSLLDASLDMLNVMKTFGEGGVDVAEDGPGKDRQREDVR